MRLRLEYFDQNERFASLLPLDGSVDAEVASVDAKTWALFRLDEPVSYDGVFYEHMLLCSRWKGREVGEDGPTSVFVLLVDDVAKVREGFSFKDFYFVAWGMAHTL